LADSRWLTQAADDLDASRFLLGKGNWSLACFMAEEAAHAALRHVFALRDSYRHMRSDHMKLELLASSIRCVFPRWPWQEDTEMQDVLETAIALDPYYLDTRYPSPEGRYPVPCQAFTEEQATAAIAVAAKVLRVISERDVALILGV